MCANNFVNFVFTSEVILARMYVTTTNHSNAPRELVQLGTAWPVHIWGRHNLTAILVCRKIT